MLSLTPSLWPWQELPIQVTLMTGFPTKVKWESAPLTYLPVMRRNLIEAQQLIIGTIDVTILCGEQPRMKKRLTDMQRNIAEGLGISLDQVHVKVSSMDGQDEIARLEGIEARVLVSLWENL